SCPCAKRARVETVLANSEHMDEEPSEFMLLPNEVHTMFCWFLPVKDRLRFGSISRRFYKLENEAGQKYFQEVDAFQEFDDEVGYRIFLGGKWYTFYIHEELLEEQQERAKNMFKRAKIWSLDLRNLKSENGIPDLNLLATSTYSYLSIRHFPAWPTESLRFANAFINSDNFSEKMLFLYWKSAYAQDVHNALRFLRTLSGLNSFIFSWEFQTSALHVYEYSPEMDAITLLHIVRNCREASLRCSTTNISAQDLCNVFKVVRETEEFRSIQFGISGSIVDQMIAILGDEIKRENRDGEYYRHKNHRGIISRGETLSGMEHIS
ncbi:hypothetical protein PFISCL1PPCAC_11646, partial [Pristionchus fissidentatus]